MLSRIDRLDEALALTARIGDPRKRERTIAVVVHGQVNRGDLADGLRLLPQLSAREQDNLAELIIRRELDARQFDRAAGHLKLIQDDDRRSRMQQLVDDTRAFPSAEDGSYVEKKVELAQKQLREQREGLRQIQPSDRGTATLDPDAEVKLITCLATAVHLHARRDEAGCRRELQTAWNIAASIKDEEGRIGEQMAIACTAFQCEARELAQEMFRELVGKPKSDGFYSAFSLLGFRPMSAIAELLRTEELGPIVKRWQSADVVIPTDYMAFVEACAKCGRLDHLEWLHGQTGSVELRLVLDVTVLEWLVQTRK